MRNTFKQDKVLFDSTARTATPTAATLSCGTVGGFFVIDVTAVTATPSVTFAINGVEPISGNTWNILTSAAITATGTTVLRVHPSLTASANLIAKDMLPQGVEVTATHGDADSITYSVRFIGVD